MSAPLTVAVVAGGRSSEHEVSLASGRAVADGLTVAGHRALWVQIERDGVWRHDGADVPLHPARGLLGADVVFPALHGPFGEDGTIQGLLELLDVAYVGSGVAASAVSMDKVLSKHLLGATGIPQVASVAVDRRGWREHREPLMRELSELGLPVFVKPARLGSSVGIARVGDSHELAPALEAAFVHDPLAIVEAAAPGLEVECSVLQSTAAGVAAGEASAIATPPGEIVLTARDGGWYDYEAKYTLGAMELIVPARISLSAAIRVRELAIEAFDRLRCEGLARVDFFVDGDSVLVNELNTMPGFTSTSVYAQLCAAAGIPFPQLVEHLCRVALERQAEQRGFRS